MSNEVAKVEGNPYLPMIKMIVEQKGDLAQLEKFMDLTERWDKEQARKAFINAMNNFKQNPPEILKDKDVSFDDGKTVKYTYADLSQVNNKIGEALSTEGLSHRWEVETKEKSISVTCIITHILGHSERVTMEGPVDTSGGKNSIQAVGSTTHYLQRYTLLSATGCAVKGGDDDGKASTNLQNRLTDVQQAELCKKIQDCKTNGELKEAYSYAIGQADILKDKESQLMFVGEKDKKLKELNPVKK